MHTLYPARTHIGTVNCLGKFSKLNQSSRDRESNCCFVGIVIVVVVFSPSAGDYMEKENIFENRGVCVCVERNPGRGKMINDCVCIFFGSYLHCPRTVTTGKTIDSLSLSADPNPFVDAFIQMHLKNLNHSRLSDINSLPKERFVFLLSRRQCSLMHRPLFAFFLRWIDCVHT